MADINIFRKYVRGQLRLKLIAETEIGRKFIISNFITISEMVDIAADDDELEEIVRGIQAETLTVEVY